MTGGSLGCKEMPGTSENECGGGYSSGPSNLRGKNSAAFLMAGVVGVKGGRCLMAGWWGRGVVAGLTYTTGDRYSGIGARSRRLRG